jgi:hypothetical protein
VQETMLPAAYLFEVDFAARLSLGPFPIPKIYLRNRNHKISRAPKCHEEIIKLKTLGRETRAQPPPSA